MVLRMRKTMMLLLVVAACGDNAEEEARKLAQTQADEAAAAKKASSPAVAYKVDVPVVGGHPIQCVDLFGTDMKVFNEGISGAVGSTQTVTMHQLDRKEQIKRQPGVNAICEFMREGVRPSAEEQKKMAEKTQRLGVLPGDFYCEVRIDCGKPFDENWEANCRKMMNHTGHRELGVFACVMKSIRAENDSFRYKVYEPDTKCFLDVLGGHPVVDDPIPRACTKAAMELITADSIAKYKNLGPTPIDLLDAQKKAAEAEAAGMK
jgi:hypothetical protein